MFRLKVDWVDIALFLLAAGSAIAGLALQGVPQVVGLAVFGFALATELFLLVFKLRAEIENFKAYRYLGTGASIWSTAREVISGADRNSTILATSSSRNDPVFEELILRKALAGDLNYTRTMCFPDNPTPDPERLGFPALPAPNGTKEEKLNSYLAWYKRHYKAWREKPSSEIDADDFHRAGMSHWMSALNKISSVVGITLHHHHVYLAADFLISRSGKDGRCEAAILAFPKKRHDEMKSGFCTTDHQLANDFDQNLVRLLEK